MKIKIFQTIFDIFRGKKVIQIVPISKSPEHMKMIFDKVHKNYEHIVSHLQKKTKKRGKIRVCFSVILDSVFPAKPIFEEMLNDDIFEPFILIIPDIDRGNDNMLYQMQKTYKTLSSEYKNVYQSYDYNKKRFIDYSKKMDLCFFANPYDNATHKLYTIEYLSKKTLTLYIPYAYTCQIKYNIGVYQLNEYGYLWKIYVENKNSLKLIHEFKKYKQNNLELSGFPKMDNMTKLKIVKRERPLIIIAPHHTVRRIPNYLNLSNFLRFQDFYLELPKKYPNVDFVFRPHPLMFLTLKEDDLWGEAKVNKYIEKINALPNMVYQEGGDYFETFNESSALINDCSSFLPEYFYFGKPQCFVLESKKELYEEFTEIGREILKHVYTAYTKEEIIKFIDDVVLKNNDFMKESRNNFAKENIILNYPNVSKTIIENLKKELEQKN